MRTKKATIMDGINYNIKAIETKFRGFTFRSRLEARWAAMFELLGWEWDYEPVDFNGWIPDFVIYGAITVYVEVKPVIQFPEEVADRIERSGCVDDVLILGQSIIYPGNCVSQLGWLGEMQIDESDYFEKCDKDAEEWETVDVEVNRVWDDALLGIWDQRIGFHHGNTCHCDQSMQDRISGENHNTHTMWPDKSKIKNLWSRAHELTRWMKS